MLTFIKDRITKSAMSAAVQFTTHPIETTLIVWGGTCLVAIGCWTIGALMGYADGLDDALSDD